MKNKKILLLFGILAIAVIGIVVYFISRPPQKLLPQTFAQLPEKPKLIAIFHHAAKIDPDVNNPIDSSYLLGREIFSVSFSPVDVSLIASVSGNGTIKLWNINNPKEPVKILSHPKKFPSIGFSPTGKLLVSAGGTLILWDVASGMKLNSLETSYGQFAFSPDGNQIATVRNEVKLWDIRNPKRITQIATLPFNETHKAKGWASAVDISSDGKLIAVGYSQGSINVWDLQTHQFVTSLETSFYSMDFLKFSPNNKYMVSGGHKLDMYSTASVKGYIMWELPSWQRKGEVLRGHVENLMFSPDGKICASANHQYFSGRGIELWSTMNGAPITSLPIKARDAAFSKDGNLLVTGEEGGIVRLWELTPQHLNLTTTPSDIVRIIYCLAKDKEPPPNIVDKIDQTIRDVQDFYADEMERHGFGRKTFTFETDENGKTKVYLIRENQTEKFDLSNDCWLAIEDDAPNAFSNVYKLIRNAGINETFQYPTKRIAENVSGNEIEGFTHGKLVYASVKDLKRKPLAYALRNGLGLPYIPLKPQSKILKNFDFLVNNVRSWRKKKAKLSKCEAEWLDKSRFFNPTQTFFDKQPKIELNISKPDNSDSRFFQFTLEDEDGIHQAHLYVPSDIKLQGLSKKLHDCQALNGKEKATVIFKIKEPEIHRVVLRMIDIHGNIASREF